MSRVRFATPHGLRACAVLLTLLCAHAQAQQLPNSVTMAGTFQSELGCPGDWDPACPNSHLDPDAEDGIWRKVFRVPGGEQQFKATINDSWVENYGANGQRDGANLVFSHTEETIDVKFFYDPNTHWVTNSSITPIAVLAGSLQTELGCPGDWEPWCMLTWLKDIDGDWVQHFSTSALPPGSYAVKVAHNENWDENYGAGGVPGGEDILFTVPAPGQEVRFTYDSLSHQLTINIDAPTVTTLTVAPNPVTRGEALTFTAAVTVSQGAATPVGTVTFRVDGQELETVALDSEGVASLTVPAFSSGTYAITADYNGVYTTSTSVPAVILLTGVATSTSLAVEPESSVYGEPIILTATVVPTEGGSEPLVGEIVFREGRTELATVPVDEAGQASFSPATPPSVGTHLYTAELRPNAPHFASQSAAVEHTVSEATSDGGMPEDAGSEEVDAGYDAGSPEDAGSEEVDAGYDAGSPEDAGSDDLDAGAPEDAGSSTRDAGAGDTDAGSPPTDAGSGNTDAGSGTDAGSPPTDAGSGGTDAGSGGTDAGSGNTDAGAGDTDAGSGGTDAGSGNTDAGSGNTDAGSGNTDAGSGNTDAGSGNTDAGTNPGTDAGTQVPDAGTPGDPPEPLPAGCACNAGNGGGAPFMMLGMWMALSVLQSRRRSRKSMRE